MSTHLVIPDPHTHPDYNNDRFIWLGQLIKDVKPDVVINLGDHWDFNSLSSYEVGRKAFSGRNYALDIDAGHDAHEKMWGPMKRSKKKMPRRIFLEGNHEHRLKRAINLQPELEGDRYGISFRDLDLDKWYTDVHEYDGGTPAVCSVDGVAYAHYFTSGVALRPISGEHPAYTLLTKQFKSCTQGHVHTLDFCRRTNADNIAVNGLVAGVFQDYRTDWAGLANDLWWRGVAIKRNVEDGNYDLELVSLGQLEREYKT